MDGKNDGFLNNEFIGYVEKSIGELMVNSKENKCTYEINSTIPYGMRFKEKKHNTKDARMIITIEEVINTAVHAFFNISCKDLDKKVRYSSF